MPRGVIVPKALRETVLRMTGTFDPLTIREFTDVSERQQSRISKLWRETGSTVPSKEDQRPRGRPRCLTAEEVAVRFGCSMFKFNA